MKVIRSIQSIAEITGQSESAVRKHFSRRKLDPSDLLDVAKYIHKKRPDLF